MTGGHCKVMVLRFLSYSRGGIEAYLNGLLPTLVDEGVEPVIVTAGVVIPEQRAFLDGLGVRCVEGNVLGHLPASPRLADRMREKHALRAFFRQVLQQGGFDAVHVNTSAPWVQHALLGEAASAGVPVRIAHGHDDLSLGESRLGRATHVLYAASIGRSATRLLACSSVAGGYLYGTALWDGRGTLARNGIDLSRFEGMGDGRAAGRFVLGNVARLSPEKNQGLLLDILQEALRLRDDAELWLVGHGPARAELERRADGLGITQRVRFWGHRDDVPGLLSQMDCLVMPSLHEGLPVSLVEAQAAGVPCLVSANVTDEVDVPGCPIEHLSLGEPACVWARRAVGLAGSRVPGAAGLVRAAGFDARDCARQMAAWYRSET